MATSSNTSLTVSRADAPVAARSRAVRDAGSDLNLDLGALDPTGAEVAAARRVPGTTDPNTGTSISGRHEDLGFVPTLTGTYKLRVRSAAGAASFLLDVPPEQRTGRQRRACLHRRGRCRAGDPDRKRSGRTAAHVRGDGAAGPRVAHRHAALLTYRPDADWNGTDFLNFRVRDGGGLESPTATVTIEVSEVNDPPQAATDKPSVAEDGILEVDPRTNDAAGEAGQSCPSEA